MRRIARWARGVAAREGVLHARYADPMSSGAYGLLGVLVGALISGGFEWWKEMRRADADAQREEARYWQADRMLAGDLMATHAALFEIVEGGDAITAQRRKILMGLAQIPAWDVYGPALVEVLEGRVWQDVLGAVVIARTLGWYDSPASSSSELPSEQFLKECRSTMQAVEKGLAALGYRPAKPDVTVGQESPSEP
jgi:hypothetical protein